MKPQFPTPGQEIVYSDPSEMFEEIERLVEPQANEEIEDKGKVSYAVEGENFIVRLDKPKKLSSRFGVLLYIFGYKHNIPFAQMPKIRIITMGRRIKVFDAKSRIIDHRVTVDFGSKALIVKIPLKLLASPDYLLVALKAYHGHLPIDAASFRKVVIVKEEQEHAGSGNR